MYRSISNLWAGSGDKAYEVVRQEITKSYDGSAQGDKDFLWRAVCLLNVFQSRLIETWKECSDWTKQVEGTKIDSARYFSWVKEVYDQLTYEQRKRLKVGDLTLENFSKDLEKANWKIANNQSVRINNFL